MRPSKNRTTGKLTFSILNEDNEDLIWPPSLREIKNPEQQQLVRSRRNEFFNEIKKIEPIKILGLTALYTLKGGALTPGYENTYPEVNDLELLQAILLSSDKEKEGESLDHSKVSAIWKELKQQCYVASHESSRANQTGLERLAQSSSAYYRNPYGDDFFDHMITSITEEYDARYIRNGSISKIGLALVALRHEIISRFKNYVESLGLILHGNNEQKISALRKIIGINDYDFNLIPDGNFRQFLHNTAEDYASEFLFRLDSEWIERKESEGLPMSEVLRSLSLETITPWSDSLSITRSNPVWTKPIFSHAGNYYLFSPLTLTSFPFSALLVFLQEKTRLEKMRGIFVENEAKALLKKAFPSALIIHSGNWFKNENQKMETDLLVLLSGHLMIFEAKGALLPDRARQGSPDALKHFLRRVWGKSIEQGNSLADRLQYDQPPLEILDSEGQTLLTLHPKEILSIARYGISVEQIGIFMNSPKLLKREEVLDDDVEPAPCIILSELKIILEALPTQEQRLHYLARRTELCQLIDFIGDELDLFVVYLQFGFDQLPQLGENLMILGASFSIHEYQNKKGFIDLPKDSVLRNSYFFNNLIERLKYRQSDAFLRAALVLYDFDLVSQLDFEKNMKLSFRRSNITAATLPAVVSKKETRTINIIICGLMVENNMDLKDIRGYAHHVFTSHCSKTLNNEGFVFVKVWKSQKIYDAFYYFHINPSTLGPDEQLASTT